MNSTMLVWGVLLDKDTLYALIGAAGASCYCCAYSLLQFGKIRVDNNIYTYINLTGACLMLISLSHHFNLGGAIIQTFWVFCSLAALARRARIKRRLNHLSRSSSSAAGSALSGR